MVEMVEVVVEVTDRLRLEPMEARPTLWHLAPVLAVALGASPREAGHRLVWAGLIAGLCLVDTVTHHGTTPVYYTS